MISRGLRTARFAFWTQSEKNSKNFKLLRFSPCLMSERGKKARKNEKTKNFRTFFKKFQTISIFALSYGWKAMKKHKNKTEKRRKQNEHQHNLLHNERNDINRHGRTGSRVPDYLHPRNLRHRNHNRKEKQISKKSNI